MNRNIQPKRKFHHDPVALDLRTPKYRKRVVQLKIVYNRKKVKKTW